MNIKSLVPRPLRRALFHVDRIERVEDQQKFGPDNVLESMTRTIEREHPANQPERAGSSRPVLLPTDRDISKTIVFKSGVRLIDDTSHRKLTIQYPGGNHVTLKKASASLQGDGLHIRNAEMEQIIRADGSYTLKPFPANKLTVEVRADGTVQATQRLRTTFPRPRNYNPNPNVNVPASENDNGSIRAQQTDYIPFVSRRYIAAPPTC